MTYHQKKKKWKKKDWYNLQAKRITIPNSYDFKIETVGVFENIDIVRKACDIVNSRIENLKNTVEDPDKLSKILKNQAESTIPNSFDIILKNEGYTLGKVIEYVLHEQYYENKKILSYVGFKKPHPHTSNSLLRIAFKKSVPTETVKNYIAKIISEACSFATWTKSSQWTN